MTEPASTATNEGLGATAANDVDDTQPPIVQINLHQQPVAVQGRTIVRHKITGLPEYWDGNVERLFPMPIPVSCIGKGIFLAFAECYNLTANIQSWLLNNPLPSHLLGKHLLLLGTEFGVQNDRSGRLSNSYVLGIKPGPVGVQPWRFGGGDTLHHIAHALTFR